MTVAHLSRRCHRIRHQASSLDSASRRTKARPGGLHVDDGATLAVSQRCAHTLYRLPLHTEEPPDDGWHVLALH